MESGEEKMMSSSASSPLRIKRGNGEGGYQKLVRVFDCRQENVRVKEKEFKSGPDFNDFFVELRKVRKVYFVLGRSCWWFPLVSHDFMYQIVFLWMLHQMVINSLNIYHTCVMCRAVWHLRKKNIPLKLFLANNLNFPSVTQQHFNFYAFLWNVFLILWKKIVQFKNIVYPYSYLFCNHYVLCFIRMDRIHSLMVSAFSLLTKSINTEEKTENCHLEASFSPIYY